MAWDERTWDKQERTRSAPAKKDRRRWCKGKVGVLHVTEIRVRSPYQFGTRMENTLCRWWPHARQPDRGPWICYHREVCVNCGKIIEHGLGKECPLWTPPPWKEETNGKDVSDR